jgi:hypothetical protein
LVEMLGIPLLKIYPFHLPAPPWISKPYQEVIISKKNYGCSSGTWIPGVFPPKEMGDNLLVDGGFGSSACQLLRCLAPTLR